ncbi:CPBP family intramembrane glutamic endopeptidase [Planomicrobium sp. CPCC 101110]|uniref:CPBP family intramembrane glutamic endopeptidase n=1 Tax=Planomicrobium sp. CPCC 101110 TaxID=2599619 RepID=UPI0011B5DA0C|nr:CPBP family intramembrane glutamic endopeptidase [Planomicrobium sp. CPCC 101110]TWT25433.1 CPBP family intramembrane metalloprotease [Planomicrobium sp. CPCC 101110]
MKTNSAPTKTKRTAKRTPLYVLLIFIAVQLLPILAVVPTFNYFKNQGLDENTAQITTSGWLVVIAMAIGFVVTLFVIARDRKFFDIWKGKKSSFPAAVGWGLLGFLMLLVGQTLAAYIEMAIGIDPGSANTQNIVTIAEVVPLTVIAVVLFGPVLEELVFRRVVFGSLNQTTNFFIATAVSALVFALVHLEFMHLLLYFTTGLILAFLYQKTKRIITPIIAHVMLNGYVMLIQLNMEKIQDFLKQLENIQP